MSKIQFFKKNENRMDNSAKKKVSELENRLRDLRSPMPTEGYKYEKSQATMYHDMASWRVVLTLPLLASPTPQPQVLSQDTHHYPNLVIFSS